MKNVVLLKKIKTGTSRLVTNYLFLPPPPPPPQKKKKTEILLPLLAIEWDIFSVKKSPFSDNGGWWERCKKWNPSKEADMNIDPPPQRRIWSKMFHCLIQTFLLTFAFKVAYYSFCTMRALIYARAAQGTRKHHACAKSR